MREVQNLVIAGFALILIACSDSPQQADPDFRPQTRISHFSPNSGPIVLIDQAHHNFLTLSGRYKPFAQVLESDGFRVRENTKKFTEQQLENADIVVIANALDRRRKDWLPPYGEALNQSEVEAIKHWIVKGGSLFLVADHSPFPKTIDNLSLALGFYFSNGHVASAIFSKANESLAAHTITYADKSNQDQATTPIFSQRMETPSPEILQVRTFGGSAFKPPEQAVSLLNLGVGAISIEPEIPFEINSDTPRVSMTGWSQGAVLKLGKGRVAVFAEGMMFSSQSVTPKGSTQGFPSVGAEQNEEFLLNVMHWLVNKD